MHIKVPASVIASVAALGLSGISQEHLEFWAESERLMTELKMLTGKTEAEILEAFSHSPLDFHQFARIVKGRVEFGLEPLDDSTTSSVSLT